MKSFPLQGKRVLDLTRNVAGPYASLILANMGADVIKVEHPRGGDDTRQWGPPFWDGQAPMFLAFNRDKRSLSLDLSQTEAREILERAVRRCDVVIESFKPGSLEALGFGCDWARGLNPGLVYCRLTAYGASGPMRDLPGYDPVMQAASGLMSVTGEPGRPPVRSGGALVDMGTGMWAAMAILGALTARAEGGEGCLIDVSLYETAIGWMAYHLPAYWGTGQPPGRSGSGAPMLAPYEAFATADGFVLITCGNDRLFGKLAEVLGQSGWATDERFARNPDRVRNRAALHSLVEAETPRHATADLETRLHDAGVPCGPIRDAAGVSQDAQAAALGLLQSADHPLLDGFRSVGMPFSFDGQRPPLTRVPPGVGQHNGEILAELDFREAQIRRLLDSPAMTGR